MVINKEIGKNIQLIRTTKNLTQEHLAHLSNMSQSHLSDIEKGADVKWSDIEKIANALEAPLAEILPNAIKQEIHNSFKDQSNFNNYSIVNVGIPLDKIVDIITSTIEQKMKA